MPNDVEIKLWFENDGERDRYQRLRKQDEMREMVGRGVGVAQQFALPVLYGHNGALSTSDLEKSSLDFLNAGFDDLTTHIGREPTADEFFMFRMGYQALTLEALTSHHRATRAGEKMAEGLAMALAGVAACDEGLRLMGAPPLSAPAPHLLGMPAKRRPLRPEDFGCLPARR